MFEQHCRARADRRIRLVRTVRHPKLQSWKTRFILIVLTWTGPSSSAKITLQPPNNISSTDSKSLTTWACWDRPYCWCTRSLKTSTGRPDAGAETRAYSFGTDPLQVCTAALSAPDVRTMRTSAGRCCLASPPRAPQSLAFAVREGKKWITMYLHEPN